MRNCSMWWGSTRDIDPIDAEVMPPIDIVHRRLLTTGAAGSTASSYTYPSRWRSCPAESFRRQAACTQA